MVLNPSGDERLKSRFRKSCVEALLRKERRWKRLSRIGRWLPLRDGEGRELGSSERPPQTTEHVAEGCKDAHQAFGRPTVST
jgi:hypothetical protein